MDGFWNNCIEHGPDGPRLTADTLKAAVKHMTNEANAAHSGGSEKLSVTRGLAGCAMGIAPVSEVRQSEVNPDPVDVLRLSTGRLNLVALQDTTGSGGPSDEGHAMGIVKGSAGETFIFDPNGGAAKFANFDDAAQFFRDHWYGSGYAHQYDRFVVTPYMDKR
jgi:hypothetical protein